MNNQTKRDSTINIFNLSFLDVFACVLGTLILILLMMAQQATSVLNEESISKRVESFKKKREEVGTRWLATKTEREAAKRWRAEQNTMNQLVESYQRQISDNQQKIVELPPVPAQPSTTTPLEKLKQQVDAIRNQLVATRTRIFRRTPSTSGPFTSVNPTSPITQEPRIVLVSRDSVTDMATVKVMTVNSAEWIQFLNLMRQSRATEYILFLLKPEGVDLYKKLEQSVKDANLIYGFEPYTSMWDAFIKPSG